jgi:hypothetical protein
MTTKNNAVKFNKHHVTDGATKAKVFYSLDNHVSMLPTVTIYAKDYSRALGKLISDAYKNDTDSLTDYFDEGRVVLQEGHPLYAAARERAVANKIADEARWAALKAKRLARAESEHAERQAFYARIAAMPKVAS